MRVRPPCGTADGAACRFVTRGGKGRHSAKAGLHVPPGMWHYVPFRLAFGLVVGALAAAAGVAAV